MDPLEVAILALRLALALTLYAFLAAVVRAARASLANPGASLGDGRVGPGSGRPSPAGQPLGLLVLEPGQSGLVAGQLLELHDGATLGRGASAAVPVDDPTVSHQHARLSRAGGGWLVTDLGSTNGTWVNQAAVRPAAPLAPGDLLTLGSVRLKVVGGSPRASQP